MFRVRIIRGEAARVKGQRAEARRTGSRLRRPALQARIAVTFPLPERSARERPELRRRAPPSDPGLMRAGRVYVLVARVPTEGVELFNRYEDAALPHLATHGGVLQR